MMPTIETDAGRLLESGMLVEAGALVEPPVPAKAARPRGKGRAKPVADAASAGEKPLSRILQLIAALKAEHETLPAERSLALVGEQAAAPVDEPAEPASVLSSLRDILVAREQERGEWEERARNLEVELIEARAAMRAGRDGVTQADAQHRRIVADLKLLHEHQRSIWQLERRRLEITIEGFENERQKNIVKRATRLARPALLAGLLIVLLALAALFGDGGAAKGSTHVGNPGSHHPTSDR